ncbi:Transglutaminase-like domain-containing protein [Sphingomonas antarctica]|uniref:transglutaminase family protein n=1 Tax=Sphingomonas antarctica TaxID=2040274 RepID=UPI0039EAAD15
MRLSIDHHTRYKFSEPQARVVQLLHMTPLDNEAQTVLDWRIDVDCDARLREGTDGYGNHVTMLYVDGPVEALAITVRGQVLTEDMAGIVRGAPEPLPPVFYTRGSAATSAGEATIALARSARGSDPLERAHRLNGVVAHAVTIEGGRAEKILAPDDILASGHATVREAAQLMVAAGRAAGFPARFVSGHSLHGPDRARRRSAHYWAELHLGAIGWVGFDPCAGASPDESYVRVAVGVDLAEVTPVAGTRIGGGVEELDVAVSVGVQ